MSLSERMSLGRSVSLIQHRNSSLRMRSPGPLHVDFARPARPGTGASLLLCGAGLAAAIAVALAFHAALAERTLLDAEIEQASAGYRAPATSPAAVAAQAEVAKVQHELSIPWTQLLAELETVSHDMKSQVSLLGVEPDAEKHVVRITAEVRSLPDALAYLQHLQQSPVLRYPMLESHERRKDDPDHAVRIKVAAEWRS
jgi:hypothetical protein